MLQKQEIIHQQNPLRNFELKLDQILNRFSQIKTFTGRDTDYIIQEFIRAVTVTVTWLHYAEIINLY